MNERIKSIEDKLKTMQTKTLITYIDNKPEAVRIANYFRLIGYKCLVKKRPHLYELNISKE